MTTAVILSFGRSGFTQQTSPEPATEKIPPESGWNVQWDNRPSVRYGELFRIDVRARFTSDLRDSHATLRDSDTTRFDIARRRVGVTGELGRVADFQVEREFAGTRAWRDVFLNYRGLDRVEIQAGQFKLPFGLDENTSSTNLDFAYRSWAAELSPGRDPGVMAHGRAGVLRYEAGLFTRDGDNARGNNTTRVFGGRTTAGRLVVQPLRSSASVFEDFQAGVAFTSSDASEGIADLRIDTALGEPFFRPQYAVQGPRRRAGMEMRWRPGPFSVQSEFIRLTSERRGQSIEETDLPPLTAAAWYAQGTWLATGEKKTKGADEPRRPLSDGGFGSIELAARVEAVRVSSGGSGMPSTGPRAETILPYRDRVITLGVSWSPIRWVRVQANLIRDTISIATADASATAPLVGDDLSPSSFWSRVVRFRFAM